MVTKCRARVSFDNKVVLQVIVVRIDTFILTWTNKSDKLMTSSVHNKITNLTLIALLSKTPNEFFAMTTVCGFFEESLNEFMAFNFMDIFLSQYTFPHPAHNRRLCHLDHFVKAVSILLRETFKPSIHWSFGEFRNTK